MGKKTRRKRMVDRLRTDPTDLEIVDENLVLLSVHVSVTISFRLSRPSRTRLGRNKGRSKENVSHFN